MKKKTTTDIIAEIFACIILFPILNFIISAIFALGFNIDFQEQFWALALAASPFTIALLAYSITHPDAGKKSGNKRYRGGSTGGSGGGWSPGCPEDKMFSSQDGNFDFDGDGKLSGVESSTKYDIFFGDDD